MIDSGDLGDCRVLSGVRHSTVSIVLRLFLKRSGTAMSVAAISLSFWQISVENVLPLLLVITICFRF